MESSPTTPEDILRDYYAYESSLPLTPKPSSPNYLNTAAFGSPYPTSLTLNTRLLELCYEQPMLYHRELVPKLMERSKKSVCSYLKISDVGKFRFVNSVSTAIFRILESGNWKPGDVGTHSLSTSPKIIRFSNNILSRNKRLHLSLNKRYSPLSLSYP